MLLTPKRWKFRKTFVKSLKGKSARGTEVAFGQFGLKATTSGYVTNRQLEAARKVIIRHIRKIGKLRYRVFPDVPLTKKWLEMPMGKGKGDVHIYAAAVKKGRIMIEITGLERKKAEEVLLKAAKKLPVKVRVVEKGEVK